MKLESAFLAIIIIFALFFCILGIKWGLPGENHIFPYCPDENTPLSILRRINLSNFDLNLHYFTNPAFHYYLIGAMLKVASFFKIIILGNSPFFYYLYPNELAKVYLVGRLITVFFSLLVIYTTYLIGKHFYNKNIGLLAAFLLSLTPIFVIQSHFMEVSIPALFWITISMLFALKIMQTSKLRYYILSGITVGLGISTKYTVIPFILIVALAHFLSTAEISDIKSLLAFSTNRKFLVFFCIAVFIFFIANPYILLSFHEFREGLDDVSWHAFHRWLHFRLNCLHPIANLLKYGMGAPLLILSIVGTIFALFRRKKADILILCWIFLYYFFVAKSKSMISRYQTGYLPFLSLLGAAAFFKLLIILAKAQLKLFKILLYSLLVFVIGHTFLNTASYLGLMINKDIREKASIWIEANIPLNSEIAVVTEPYWFSPDIIYNEYFYNGRNPVYKNPHPKYTIINLDNNSGNLKIYRPAYIILTDFEIINVTFGNVSFSNYLAIRNEYEEIERFEEAPAFLSMKFSEPFFPRNSTYNFKNLCSLLRKYPPTDFKILSPTIMIFKRK